MSAPDRRNDHGQPVGAALPGWTPRPLPPRRPLTGRFCRLEPLRPDHAGALFAAYAEAPDDRDWTYLPYERAGSAAAFRETVAARVTSDDPLHMTVIVDGEPLGSAALMRIDPQNGVVEIGFVHFSPRLQRTAAATEAITMLARRAFDDLGYRRLEWKCDSRNAPSRKAAQRLGFVFEGVFRHAVVTKGRNRDTAWYAMTAEDWTITGRALQDWLAPANFDAGGRQIQTLASLRAAGA